MHPCSSHYSVMCTSIQAQCSTRAACALTAGALGVVTGECPACQLLYACLRFKDMSADHDSVAKELERANEEFKEFERKDIKYREDVKHLKAKLKKLQDKLAKDTAKMQVCSFVSDDAPKTPCLLLVASLFGAVQALQSAASSILNAANCPKCALPSCWDL